MTERFKGSMSRSAIGSFFGSSERGSEDSNQFIGFLRQIPGFDCTNDPSLSH